MSRLYIFCLVLAGLVIQVQADVSSEVVFTDNPGNGATDPTHVWTVYADGTQTATDGAANSIPTTGDFSNYASGSFTMTVSAVYNFNPTTFASDLGIRFYYDGGGDNYGPSTPDDLGINTIGDEAILITFNLSGLTLDSGADLYLSEFQWWNDGPGNISYFNGTTATQLTAPTTGTNVWQALDQVIHDGDQIAMWRGAGGGQLRMTGFGVAAIPEPATIGLIGVGALLAMIGRRLF